MTQLIISSILFLLFFLLIARTTITFSPFSIKFERLIMAIGWVLIIAGVECIITQSYREGRRDFKTLVIHELDSLEKAQDTTKQDTTKQDTIAPKHEIHQEQDTRDLPKAV